MNRILFCLLLLFPAIAAAQPIDLTRGGATIGVDGDDIEVRDQEHFAQVTGNARATRGEVTVLADQIIARYRRKGVDSADNKTGVGSNEIYRLEAHGNVRIFTATDTAVGATAVYDIDQAVLVLTGGGLKITTPQQIVTARDSLEYWSDKHMAVARGKAVVVTADARRLAADTLVAYTDPTPDRAKPAAAKPDADPLGVGGQLKRVEAYGNVEIRTVADTARGDRGLYLADRSSAWLEGNVILTSASGELKGAMAEVNMKTGVGKIVRSPGTRVQGMILPGKPKP